MGRAALLPCHLADVRIMAKKPLGRNKGSFKRFLEPMYPPN
jgi:hypothetical protein